VELVWVDAHDGAVPLMETTGLKVPLATALAAEIVVDFIPVGCDCERRTRKFWPAG
jgi:hypothetical protein